MRVLPTLDEIAEHRVVRARLAANVPEPETPEHIEQLIDVCEVAYLRSVRSADQRDEHRRARRELLAAIERYRTQDSADA